MEPNAPNRHSRARRVLTAVVLCAASLAVLLGGYTCFAPFWQPDYAPAAARLYGPEELFMVNLNTATAAELMTLPGLGQSTAANILAHREKYGGFTIVDELILVEGVSNADLEAWRPYLYIE